MKNKTYFVDRIIKLRGRKAGPDREELLKLTMVEILNILNTYRVPIAEDDDLQSNIPPEPPAPAKKPRSRAKDDDILMHVPDEKKVIVKNVVENEEDGFVSLVSKFLFTSQH
jgi:hypothetical protein